MNNPESVDRKIWKVPSVKISSGFKDLRKCETGLKRQLESILKISKGFDRLSIRPRLPTVFSRFAEAFVEKCYCEFVALFLKPLSAIPEIHV